MEIELDPPNGITGFPLGMPAEELKAEAGRLGRIKVSDEGSSARFRYMKVLALHEQFEIVFHLEDGRTLASAEVWTPAPAPRRSLSASAAPTSSAPLPGNCSGSSRRWA
ncbi:hypothetical protein ACFW9F_24745 [Streptomyces sp. NPDC059506]|uniref:hypothetical protein n=1 Tax=Streptomyces sp. NPDC059506 TaxID=3347751 RepID=UPI0036CD52FA